MSAVRVKQILATPGFVVGEDANELRELLGREEFVEQSFDQFGYACYSGAFVHALVLLGAENTRPDLTGRQPPMGYTYATLLVLGYIGRVGPDDCEEDACSSMLLLLLCAGVPIDSQDIIGRTDLHHAANSTGICGLTKVLLRHKTDVNLRDRFGATPLLVAIQRHTIDVIPLLLDADADLDLADGEGSSSGSMYPIPSTEVFKAVKNWLAKHEGKGEVLQRDRCNKCGTRSDSVKRCARCRSQLYCSPECQRSDWKAHKKDCQPFNKEENLIVVTPSYAFGDPNRVSSLLMVPHSPRDVGGPALIKQRFETNVPDGRHMVLKIQVCLNDVGMLVYDKKRTFECFLDYDKNPTVYTRLEKIIREKGILGLKAYFAAELKSRDELVVSVAECLPESRF